MVRFLAALVVLAAGSAPQAASCIELLDRFLGCAEAATQT